MKPAASATHNAPQASGHQKNTPSYGRRRVNHIHVNKSEDAPDVAIGEYLVNSTLAMVLFDSGASHSFVSSKFVSENNLPTALLKIPLMTQSPGAAVLCHLRYNGVKIILSGVVFRVDLVVLKSSGVDVIPGMDWLAKHQGNISCGDRTVSLVHPDGIMVKCQPRRRKIEAMVCHTETTSMETVVVLREYPDVFPEELPGMPPDKDIEFIIDLLPGSRPIAKRPYRMAANELEELKKQLAEL